MNLGSIEQRTEGMKKQAQELIEQAYNRGYKAGYEACKEVKDVLIEKGRNEAWETVKKLYLPVDEGGLPGGEVKKIFGVLSWIHIVQKYSASEVVEKLRAYEEQKKEEDSEIHVGDEVAFPFPGGSKFIIVSVSENGEIFDGLSVNGVNLALDKDHVTKTGRTFPEVAEFMKKLKEK